MTIHSTKTIQKLEALIGPPTPNVLEVSADPVKVMARILTHILKMSDDGFRTGMQDFDKGYSLGMSVALETISHKIDKEMDRLV